MDRNRAEKLRTRGGVTDNEKMTGRRGFRSLRFALSLLVAGVPVEEVIGLVRHKRRAPDVRLRATARRWRHPSGGVQSLNEGGLHQLVAARRPRQGSNILHIYQEPGDRARLDEPCVRRRTVHPAPDCTRVPGVLPSGAYDVVLEWVGTEELGSNLLYLAVEQGGLRRKQFIGHSIRAVRLARVARQATVVLCAGGVPHEENHVPLRYLNIVGHGRRCDAVIG